MLPTVPEVGVHTEVPGSVRFRMVSSSDSPSKHHATNSPSWEGGSEAHGREAWSLKYDPAGPASDRHMANDIHDRPTRTPGDRGCWCESAGLDERNAVSMNSSEKMSGLVVRIHGRHFRSWYLRYRQPDGLHLNAISTSQSCSRSELSQELALVPRRDEEVRHRCPDDPIGDIVELRGLQAKYLGVLHALAEGASVRWPAWPVVHWSGAPRRNPVQPRLESAASVLDTQRRTVMLGPTVVNRHNRRLHASSPSRIWIIAWEATASRTSCLEAKYRYKVGRETAALAAMAAIVSFGVPTCSIVSVAAFRSLARS